MIQVVNQFRRIFSDNGSGDKDFSKQEEQLRMAQAHLHEATDALRKASEILTGLIHSRTTTH